MEGKNENKESLKVRFIKHFYGIKGVMDEYKEKEVNRIGNNAFMGLWWYMMLSNFVAVLFAYRNPAKTFWIYSGCNIFVTIFIVCVYIIFASWRAGLLTHEVEKKYAPSEKKRVLRKSFGLGVYFGVAAYLLNLLMEWFASDLTASDFASVHTFARFAFEGLFFGFFMYLYERIRLRKVE